MSEQELLNLCEEPLAFKRLNWVTEVYGFGSVLRKFGWYPKSLPLNIYFSHGVTTHEVPSQHELDNRAPFMFYFSPRLVRKFKELSKKPCYCVISPNVFYRRKYGVERDRNAKGTLAFLAHTTPLIQDRMDYTRYIDQLKSLPDIFHPISVCIHYHDVKKNAHKPFYNAGFDVVTMGHPFNGNFINRFYSTLQKFRFTTSNEIGSYSFYAPEMNIPFFLYGDGPLYFNQGDTNIEMGSYSSFRETNQYILAKNLFSSLSLEVSDAQRDFVYAELGVNDSISRLRFSLLLYYAYCIHIFSKLSRFAARLIK